MATNSIVDYLSSKGQDSSFANRAKLAQAQGIQNYTGTAGQNTQLLGLLSQPAPKSVSASSIQPGNQIAIPQNNVSQIPALPVVPQQQTDVNNATTQNNQAEQSYNQANLDLQTLSNQLANKGTDILALEQQQGIPQISQNVLDLQDLANQKALEANLTPYSLQGQGRGIPTQILRGQEALKQRQLQVEGIFANAQLQAAQGKLQLAQSQVDRAINLKYEPILAKIEVQKQILENNKYLLSRADQKLATAKQNLLEQQKQEQLDKKERETAVNAIALEVAKNGGSPEIQSAIAKAIQDGKSVGEVISLAAGSLKTPSTEIVKLGDNNAYLIDKTTGKIIKSFGTGTGSGTGSGSTSTFNPAVDVILSSGKFTKEQAAQIRNSINNGENPSVVIKNNAKQLMTGANQTKLENYEATQSAMRGLKDALNAFYAAGGDTSLIKGNFEKVSNRLGEVNDPNLAQLAVEVQSQLQSYRNAISGTAYSDQEGRDIASVFPGINKSKQLNDAIFAGRDRALQGSIDGMYKSVLGDKIYASLNQTAQTSNVSKGTMKDSDFIEKALSSKNIKYESFINGTQPGEIPVIDNITGQPFYITPAEYNPSKYTKA